VYVSADLQHFLGRRSRPDWLPGGDGFVRKGPPAQIVVRDFGIKHVRFVFCQEGGGYELTVEGHNASGGQLSSRDVNLGGGPQRNVPAWALEIMHRMADVPDHGRTLRKRPSANRGRQVAVVHPALISWTKAVDLVKPNGPNASVR
jgi:hypothetical protein